MIHTVGVHSDDLVYFKGEEYSNGAYGILKLPDGTEIKVEPDYSHNGWEFNLTVPDGTTLEVVDPNVCAECGECCEYCPCGFGCGECVPKEDNEPD